MIEKEEIESKTEIKFTSSFPESKNKDYAPKGLILVTLAIICAIFFQSYWQKRNDILLSKEEIIRFQSQVENMLKSMGEGFTTRYGADFDEIKQTLDNLDTTLKERNKIEAEKYAQIEHKAKDFFAKFNPFHENFEQEERELTLLKSGHYTTHVHTLEQTLHDLHLQTTNVKSKLLKEISEHLPEFITLDEFEDKKAEYQKYKESQIPASKEEVEKQLSDYIKALLRNPKFVSKITDYYLDEIYHNRHSPLRGDIKQILSNKEELKQKMQQIIEEEIEKRLFNWK